jgi:hypothetical protein
MVMLNYQRKTIEMFWNFVSYHNWCIQYMIVEVNNTVIYVIADAYNRWKKRYSWRKQYLGTCVHAKNKNVCLYAV